MPATTAKKTSSAEPMPVLRQIEGQQQRTSAVIAPTAGRVYAINPTGPSRMMINPAHSHLVRLRLSSAQPPAPPETLLVANAQLPQPLQRLRSRNAAFEADPDAPTVAFPPDGAEVELLPGGLMAKVEGGTAPGIVFVGEENNLARRQLIQRFGTEDFKRAALLCAALQARFQNVAKRIWPQDADVPGRSAVGKCIGRPADVVGEIAQEGGHDPVRVGRRQILAGNQPRQIPHPQQRNGPQTQVGKAVGSHGRDPHQNLAT